MGLDLRKGGPVTEPGRTLGPSGFSGETEPYSGAALSGASKYFGAEAQPDIEPPARPAQRFDDEPPVVAEVKPDPSDLPPAPLPAAAGATGDDALRAALLRGMGLDPAQFPAQDAETEMEAMGARFRELVDGLMMLLRSRAQEKSRARVAQTIIANEDVNPLKFLATPEDALAALIRPRGKGYLPPDQAVTWAYRDLADHQMRTWTALQAALRRMIDRFDPEQIEKEAEDLGLLEKLIAGGKSAKMWDMYEEHYRDLAKSAEEQFLGEVGADFARPMKPKGVSEMYFDRRKFLVFGTAGVALAGCMGPSTANMAVSVQGSAGMNPGPDGQDRPVTVSILQMTGTSAFDGRRLCVAAKSVFGAGLGVGQGRSDRDFGKLAGFQSHPGSSRGVGDRRGGRVPHAIGQGGAPQDRRSGQGCRAYHQRWFGRHFGYDGLTRGKGKV